MSGCTGVSSTCIQNTINPSELNLWRVIRKNDNGTIEVVSEYVSGTKVSFYGKTGYINLVGALNTIAAQYTNEKYVQSTRHMGYSNQTEKITDTSKLDQMSAPWFLSTTWSEGGQLFSHEQVSNCDREKGLCGDYENLGAGDLGYIMDYTLVNKINGLMGRNSNELASEYFLASRYYYSYDKNKDWWSRGVAAITEEGIVTFKYFEHWSYNTYNWSYNTYIGNCVEIAIRPIITLKSDVQLASGDGSSIETAYQFE